MTYSPHIECFLGTMNETLTADHQFNPSGSVGLSAWYKLNPSRGRKMPPLIPILDTVITTI